MRAFVFLLILANLAFAAWTHGYIPAGSSPDALRVQRQFNPELLRIVARDEPPPLVEKNGKAERVEKPVAASIALVTSWPMEPAMGLPFSSIVAAPVQLDPSAGIAPSATATIEKFL